MSYVYGVRATFSSRQFGSSDAYAVCCFMHAYASEFMTSTHDFCFCFSERLHLGRANCTNLFQEEQTRRLLIKETLLFYILFHIITNIIDLQFYFWIFVYYKKCRATAI